MRPPLKILITLSAIMIIGLLTLGITVFINSSSRINARFEVKSSSFQMPTSIAEINEGKRIYISRGCSDCHGKDLSGVTFINDPAIGVYSGSNLSSGKGGLPSTYQAEDFERAIRHGVGREGRALLFMPATDFHAMSDEDLGRIVAYIKSAPGIDSEPKPIIVGPLSRFLFFIGKMPHLITAERINHNEQFSAKMIPALTKEYGKYIATTCTGCHGENLKGGPIPGAPPEWPLAQDITSAGIGKWTEAEFMESIRKGIRPDGSEIKAPMPWQNFALMTDIELKSLRIYLLSLP